MTKYPFRVFDTNGKYPYPGFVEVAIPLCWLLQGFLMDADGQEDLYLSYIAKAEAGEPTLDLYNEAVNAQLYSDGRVILEELQYSAEIEADRGPPTRAEITLAEAKQLILDWVAAKKEWQESRAATKAVPATEPATGPGAPGATAQIATNIKGSP